MKGESENSVQFQVRVDGSCGTIMLASHGRRNALSRSVVEQLGQAFDDLHQERRVRAVILMGIGDCFSVGSDLHEIRDTMCDEAPQQTWFSDANQLRSVLTAMLQFPKPIIAAVNGPALGTGMALVAACDMVLAAPQARFGFPEARRGLTAGVAIPLIAFRLGAGHAGHLLLRGHSIDAQEAHRIGLVHEIVDDDLLWARGREWADEVALASPVSLAMTKRVLNETVGEPFMAYLATAAAAMATARTTEDAQKGVKAFLEKRPPEWN